MLIYILNGTTLERVDVLEEYESCLWTERFIESGDATIVVPATHKNAVRLRPNTLLLHEDSDEPMVVNTRETKDGMMTAVAKTVESFWNNRTLGSERYGDETPLFGWPPNIMLDMVLHMQNRWEGRFAFPNLRVMDGFSGFDIMTLFNPSDNVIENFKAEKVHDALIRMAQKYVLGPRVKRLRNEETGNWELVFTVQLPEDRSEGDRFVRLSPDDDTLENIHEVYSLEDWVDVVVALPPTLLDISDMSFDLNPETYPDKIDQGGPGDFRLDLENPFDWRVREITTTEKLTEEYLNQRVTTYYNPHEGFPSWIEMDNATLAEIIKMEMRRLAEQEYKKLTRDRKIVIDGEIPAGSLQFGRDYHLGNTVQVEGDYTGGKRKAMVTEFIRSGDNTGSRSYPTLAEPPERVPGEYASLSGWGGSGT